jgi:hypothetical protein
MKQRSTTKKSTKMKINFKMLNMQSERFVFLSIPQYRYNDNNSSDVITDVVFSVFNANVKRKNKNEDHKKSCRLVN